ncbi:MAG: ATP-grasp domain-containing protein [Gemmatimonadota bacterium]
MTKVVVTDGEQRASLAVVRSLGRAGYHVVVCAKTARSLAGASRWARASHLAPDPLADPSGFAESARELCVRIEADLLLPITDAALEAILPVRTHFGTTLIPFPDVEAYNRASDKAYLVEQAEALGIPAPRGVQLDSPDEEIRSRELPSFPLVIKPSRSVVHAGRGKAKVSVHHVPSLRDLREALARYPEAAYPLLLQERIEGTGEGGFFLMRDGLSLAEFAHRRLREKPPSGGVSVYREAVPMSEDVRSASLALLRELDWQGVAMVEFLRSRSDGRAYLMEINGRFWGSLQLAVDAGVNFPVLLAESAMGRPVTPITEYRVGLRSRWWLGDLDHLLIRLRRRTGAVDRAPELGSLLGAVARFLIPWRPGDRSEVMRLSDPEPAYRELVQWIRALRNTRGEGQHDA